MLCAIWYHLCNLKNVKNTYARMVLLVKLQALACNFTKLFTLLCTDGTKSLETSYFLVSVITFVMETIIGSF